MKKIAALFLFFFACNLVQGQTLVFRDKETAKGIEGVFVVVTAQDAKQRKTYVSDLQGEVQLDKFAAILSLKARHINYLQLQDTLQPSVSSKVYHLVPLNRELKEVVVTGQFDPQPASESVYQLRVIDQERIRAQGATQLQDVLANELNIRFTQDLALGSSNLSMQGLSGQNVKVLLDGMPMTGRQGTSNEININQIDINSVERVEIVEGPMSVVYGGDALAGVINIITKKPVTDKLALHARMHEETVGKEYGSQEGIHNQYAGVAWQRKGWQLSANGGRNYFGGWQGANEGRSKEWHPKTQWLANALAGYKADDFHLWYRLDALDETIHSYGPFSGIEALDKDFITKRFMHQLQTTANFRPNLHATAALSYTDFERKTLSTTVNKNTGDIRLALGEGLQDITRFSGVDFRTTVTYNLLPELAFQPGVEVNRETGSGERLKEGVQELNDYAFFLSAEVKPISRVSLRPGFRLIHNTGYDAPSWVPSLSARAGLGKNLDLRLAYGRGFRVPSLRELYFNFFDSNHAVEGNPDLEAEFSHSFNASLSWEAVKKEGFQFSTTAGVFYNDVDNRISTGLKPGGEMITTYINIDHYKTTGFTLNNTLQWNQLKASVGFSYTGLYNSFEEESEELPIFNWSPELNSNLSYHVPSLGTDLNFYYKFTGKTPYYELGVEEDKEQIRLAETAAYHWADLSIRKQLGSLLSLTGGCRNVFNVVRINDTSLASGAHSTAGPKPVGYGRSYFLSLNINWQER